MMMGTRIEVSGIQQAIMTGKTERPLQLSQLRAWLSDTPYDCKCVRKVDGGYINLTVRGDLRKPLEDGNQSVVVKQSFEFAVVAPDSPCSLTRSLAETSILEALTRQPIQVVHGQILVRPPRHYRTFSRPGSHIKIIEEFPHAQGLTTLLGASVGSLSSLEAKAVGHALGTWLHAFHTLAEARLDSQVSKAVSANSWAEDITFTFLHQTLLQQVRDFPSVLAGVHGEKVLTYGERELRMAGGEGYGLVHGDFSVRNIVLSSASPDQTLGIVDWECCRYGYQQQDLAVLLSDFYIAHHLSHSVDGLRALEGTMDGYPILSETVAFRVVARIGVLLLAWNATAPVVYDASEIEEMIGFGGKLIVMGSERDREGIQETVFAPLLRATKLEGSGSTA